MKKKPNVLVILTDQQSNTMMSCAGNEWLKTENMDAIANSGMRLTNCYCTNPVCLPSRFSFLTGMYPSEIGVKSNAFKGEMTEPLPSFIKENGLGKLLTENGYHAIYGGKEHFPGFTAQDLGFDYCCRDERDVLSEQFSEKLKTLPNDEPFCMIASLINPHDICLMAIRDFANNPNDMFLAERMSVEIGEVDKAIAMSKEFDEQVFFETHCPPLPDNYLPAQDEPEAIKFIQEQRGFKKLAREKYTDKQWRMHRWVYARLTEQVDRQIGKLLDALKESGKWDNTVIIFTSDHGDMDSSHKMEHKTTLYQEATRVPLIVKGLSGKTGVCDSLISNGLDLVPTILDYAEIPPPKYLMGKSLRPLLEGGEYKEREAVTVESELGKMVATKEYSYHLYDDGENREQIFEAKTNPGQMFNQIDEKNMAKAVKQAREYIASKSKKTLDTEEL